MKKQTSHKLSIKRWVILTLVFGFVATAGAVIIDIDYSMRQLKNETAAQYLSILNMQRESLDTDIGKASAVLLSYKMSGKHINKLINCKDKNEAYFAVTNVTSDLESQILNSTISEIVYAYKFGFDRFGIALSSNSHISSAEKLAVKDYVESLERETAGTNYMWKPCLIGDEWYFIYNIADRDYVIGQGIRVKTIASLFQMKLDDNSSIAVLNDQEENMIDSAAARTNNQFLKNYTERYSSYNIYEDQIIVYTYSLNLYRSIFFIKDGLLSQNFLNIVRLLWSTVFLIIVICFIIFNNITFAILRPVKVLNKCLESIRDGNLKAKIPINPSVPREFLDVYNTLNEMTSRIQELKIESYESELKRTHYELQFLSIQIEPHFYLNSMKYIYALAQTKQYETLKSMILNLADCFRYLTYDNEKMVPLQKELEHVEHYLTITNSGSPSCVRIFLSVHPHAKEVLVPKLLVQTFVENSIKYGANGNLEIDIDVQLYGDDCEQFLQLRISDNGKGFDEVYLSEIRKNGFNDQSGRIGLSNLYNRLKLFYPDYNYLTIYNNDDSFRYAQTAIRIGCCDYILQPVDYEKLQEAIIRVINNRLTQQIEKAWNNSVNERQELERNRQSAWRKILVKVPQYDLNTMQEILEETQLFFNNRQSFRIILIALLWRKESLDSWTSHAEDDCFLKIKKAIAKDFPVAAGFEVDMTTWCIILEDPENRNIPPRLQPFVRVETKEGVSSLAFYVSERTKLENLPETYQKLQKLSSDNVGKYAGVYEYRECEDSHNEELVTCDELSMQKWKIWLLDGKGELIKEEVKNFLFSRDKHSKIDRTTLLLIVQLVINVFYSFDLQSAEHLMAKQSVANLFTKATDSPSELLLFLDAVIAQYQERRNAASADAGAALLKKVRSYIDSHIESRLDRNEISEKFFISKDYLSHLFSKYEHKGYSQYVCEERLNKAKRLMLETNLPLKVISENVGISDYAYFSKLFKSHEGVSANEFRAIHRKTS